MDVQIGEASQQPNKDAMQRLKKLMVGLRSEFGGHESAIGMWTIVVEDDGDWWRYWRLKMTDGFQIAWRLEAILLGSQRLKGRGERHTQQQKIALFMTRRGRDHQNPYISIFNFFWVLHIGYILPLFSTNLAQHITI
uniref:Uncharacterized protein n=1 Tax=Lactuca sativa TaxID=4236 RepID=A0A9R1UH89_LACSA|nr:hypothetical protein LSAT_V11C900459570 [Lactuca sativa]